MLLFDQADNSAHVPSFFLTIRQRQQLNPNTDVNRDK